MYSVRSQQCSHPHSRYIHCRTSEEPLSSSWPMFTIATPSFGSSYSRGSLSSFCAPAETTPRKNEKKNAKHACCQKKQDVQKEGVCTVHILGQDTDPNTRQSKPCTDSTQKKHIMQTRNASCTGRVGGLVHLPLRLSCHVMSCVDVVDRREILNNTSCSAFEHDP